MIPTEHNEVSVDSTQRISDTTNPIPFFLGTGGGGEVSLFSFFLVTTIYFHSLHYDIPFARAHVCTRMYVGIYS